MKHIINVKTFAPPAGQEYSASAYPGPGLYHHPSTLTWVLVYSMSGTVAGMYAISLGVGYSCPIPMEKYEEPKPIEPAKVETGVTASDLLKAIAISQNPLLAKELLK